MIEQAGQDSRTEHRRYIEKYSEDEILLIRESFAVRLKTAFDRASNAEIARRLKTTDATIKNYTDATRLPTFEMLLQISRVTGVNLHWLMTGDGPQRITRTPKIFSDQEESELRAAAAAAGRTYEDQVRTMCLLALDFKGKI